MHPLRHTIPCLLLIGLAAQVAASAAGTPRLASALQPYEVTRAVVSGEDLAQIGLLYRPTGSHGLVPGVVVLHGWAPPGSVGAGLVAELAFQFQQAGYIALALSLRGWPETGGVDDCGARQAKDVVQAVRWLARQPGVDPERIALVGHSQGGQVALLAAAKHAPVHAVVAYAPVTDLRLWAAMTHLPGIAEYVEDECSRDTGLRARSPIHFAARIKAPVLLVHGTGDSRVHLVQSSRFLDALARAGGKVELKKVPDAGHHWSDLGGAGPTLEFLQRALEPR